MNYSAHDIPCIIISSSKQLSYRYLKLSVCWDHTFPLTGSGAAVISRRYQKVNASEGKEYGRIYIDFDAEGSLSRPGVSSNEFGNEANIAHVAFSRATMEFYLPTDFKGILTAEWQVAIKQYELIQNPKTSHAHRTRRAKGVSLGYSGPRSSQLMT
ncbi:hypothetical protein PITCH_A580018 [uncultured Desulfobacterium sp.]|uniref:Uncharacterized protein n=1 Tax=uncultured Desulfobacterium sp. TaxID=201089 RepID=A0A445N105_9BACT|nr:hypothetical protein PITCH_A580018 [uncultured Desulfobacterium sp.]